MSKGTGAEAMAFAYFNMVETKVAWGSNKQRGWKRKPAPGKRNLATKLKNLSLILGNRESFRKILRQPRRAALKGQDQKSKTLAESQVKIVKQRGQPQRACTHPTNLKGRSLDSISSSPFSTLEGHFFKKAALALN